MLLKADLKELFSSYGKPHKPVMSEIVSRWIKDELACAGVNISLYKAPLHSNRITVCINFIKR